jgi:hypothetical protein
MNSHYTRETDAFSPTRGTGASTTRSTDASSSTSAPLPPPPSNRRTSPYSVVLETLVPAKRIPSARTFFQPTIHYGLTPVPVGTTNTTTDNMDDSLNRFATPNQLVSLPTATNLTMLLWMILPPMHPQQIPTTHLNLPITRVPIFLTLPPTMPPPSNVDRAPQDPACGLHHHPLRHSISKMNWS